MTDPQSGPPARADDGENIFALVAQLARRASDGQLVIVAAALVGLVRADWWFVALPLLSVGCFGVWGIAERMVAERTARLGPDFGGRLALASVRLTAAVVGSLAGTLTLLVILSRMICTWKS